MRRRAPTPSASGFLRHDLRLVDWDIEVTFAGGAPAETLKVVARDPMSAMQLASYAPSREWTAAKLLSVHGMRVMGAAIVR